MLAPAHIVSFERAHVLRENNNGEEKSRKKKKKKKENLAECTAGNPGYMLERWPFKTLVYITAVNLPHKTIISHALSFCTGSRSIVRNIKRHTRIIGAGVDAEERYGNTDNPYCRFEPGYAA